MVSAWLGGAVVDRMSAAFVGKRVTLIEVKEKYALLIVKHDEDETDQPAAAAIEAAAREAEATCDQCGSAGAMREDDNGRVSVRCDEHAEGAEPISVRYADILAAGDWIAKRNSEALRLLAE
jgi:hypothetical protein